MSAPPTLQDILAHASVDTPAIIVVSGTTTDIGKTIATAALVTTLTAAGHHPAVCKPAQTGVEDAHNGPNPDNFHSATGDCATIAALCPDTPVAELSSYRQPMAPESAALEGSFPMLDTSQLAGNITTWARHHRSDVIIIEGAGGILVRLAENYSVLDCATDLGAHVLVVTGTELGTLNHTELTTTAICARGLHPIGLILGRDLPTSHRNHLDLPRVTGTPIIATIPEGSGQLTPQQFADQAPHWWE